MNLIAIAIGLNSLSILLLGILLIRTIFYYDPSNGASTREDK